MKPKALEFADMLVGASSYPGDTNLPYTDMAAELRRLFDRVYQLECLVDKLEYENKGIEEWQSLYWDVEKKYRLLTDGNAKVNKLLQVLDEIKPYL